MEYCQGENLNRQGENLTPLLVSGSEFQENQQGHFHQPRNVS